MVDRRDRGRRGATAPSASVEWAPLPAVTASSRRGCAGRAGPLRGRAVATCAWTRWPATPPRRTRAFARGRPRGAARHVGAPRHRRADGAARRGRRLGRGERPLHRPRGRRRARYGRRPTWPARSACPRARCAWWPRDVGGNFGTRNSCYPEFALVAWAARRLGRPVKWTGERREAFLADYQGRDLVVATPSWRSTPTAPSSPCAATNTSNVGAHAVSFHPAQQGHGAVRPPSTACPPSSMRGRAVRHATRRRPRRTAARAGREVMFVMERLIDLAARRHGFDRVELRRRNLVPAGAMPYRIRRHRLRQRRLPGAPGSRASTLADWAGFEARRAEARRRGRYRGIGVANYIELEHRRSARARAHHRAAGAASIDVVLGTLSSGQGHETSFAQLIAEWLGVELAQVRLITGDTDRRRGRRRRRTPAARCGWAPW